MGEDGEGAQECIICFVEYAVGDEMGRLECLCKFHKVCSALLNSLFDILGANVGVSRAYGNGGTRKVRDLVRCIRREHEGWRFDLQLG